MSRRDTPRKINWRFDCGAKLQSVSRGTFAREDIHLIVQPEMFASFTEGLVRNLVSRFLLASNRLGSIEQRDVVDQKD